MAGGCDFAGGRFCLGDWKRCGSLSVGWGYSDAGWIYCASLGSGSA